MGHRDCVIILQVMVIACTVFCSGRDERLKPLLLPDPASLLSPPALFYVLPVLTGIQHSLAFP